ncbi:hypothetical protein AOLI_G00041140 [Acnodon oligacanthus]
MTRLDGGSTDGRSLMGSYIFKGKLSAGLDLRPRLSGWTYLPGSWSRPPGNGWWGHGFQFWEAVINSRLALGTWLLDSGLWCTPESAQTCIKQTVLPSGVNKQEAWAPALVFLGVREALIRSWLARVPWVHRDRILVFYPSLREINWDGPPRRDQFASLVWLTWAT